MREGQLVYRSGEVVFNGVLEGGRSEEENVNQMRWLLESANSAALSHIGVDPKEKVELIWVPKTEYESVQKQLASQKGQILVRVRSLANTVMGQPVVCQFEVIPNKLVYAKNQIIYQKVLNMAAPNTTPEEILMNYLQDINHVSVEAGVLPGSHDGKGREHQCHYGGGNAGQDAPPGWAGHVDGLCRRQHHDVRSGPAPPGSGEGGFRRRLRPELVTGRYP
jgi:hypothetical protein